MNSNAPSLEQLIGQTEKSMNAILNRLLAGAVTEPQWVTLVLTARSGGSADRDQFSDRVAHALQVDQATAADHIGQLAAKGLVSTAGGAITLTDAGQQLLDRVPGTNRRDNPAALGRPSSRRPRGHPPDAQHGARTCAGRAQGRSLSQNAQADASAPVTQAAIGVLGPHGRKYSRGLRCVACLGEKIGWKTAAARNLR